MWNKPFGRSYKLNDVVSEQIRFYGGNPKSFYAFLVIQCFYQVDKPLRALSLLQTEITSVHARDHNFFCPGVGNFSCGFHNIENRVAAA